MVHRTGAAVALIEGDGTAVLLLKRIDSERDAWSGTWCLPGGRIEQEDPDALATAIREAKEECGIDLARRGAMPLDLRPAGRPGREVLVAPFRFSVSIEQTTVRLNPGEHAKAQWLPLARLLDERNHRLRSVPGQPPDRLVPCLEIGDPVPVWGFTYRLLCEAYGVRHPGG